MKTLLILGASGAMGSYLVEKALAAGYDVTGVSMDDMEIQAPNFHHVKTNAANTEAFVSEITKKHFDAVVDFLTYSSAHFRVIAPYYLGCTDQYFYLSSCRVFANEENPIRETSPRLCDVSADPKLLCSDDYCIYKARSENYLRVCGKKNWTIVRPSTTYSRRRCQLLTLERDRLLPNMRSGDPVPLYEGAKDIPASLTWGGDVADMLMGLLFKEEALGEDFNITTSESLTWGEIADIYHELFGLNYVWTDELTYQRFKNPSFDPEKNLGQVWQLRYARLFNRVYDNSKMLRVTGLSQSNFLTLYEGLKRERATILDDKPAAQNGILK